MGGRGGGEVKGGIVWEVKAEGGVNGEGWGR